MAIRTHSRRKPAVMIAVFIGVGIAISSCSSPGSSTGSPPPAEQVCPRSSFTFSLDALGATGLTPTSALNNGSYRTLRAGQTRKLLTSSHSGSEISLSRGPDSSLFAISAYAHGPVPLEPLAVLGSAWYLYPAKVDQQAGPRIPFRYPIGVSGDPACDRYQLEGVGVDDATLARVASSLHPDG